MKKLYPFFLIMLCMAGAVALSSCSDDDSSSSGDPDMPESGNALICNGVVREIKSAVYTVETPGNGEKADVPEAAPVYTIYLSPTAGLVDADGMLIADDAVKITVKQPSGAVDLTAAGNGIVYGEIDVNSSNVGEASKAVLSVEFLSARVARITDRARIPTLRRREMMQTRCCWIKFRCRGTSARSRAWSRTTIIWPLRMPNIPWPKGR